MAQPDVMTLADEGLGNTAYLVDLAHGAGSFCSAPPGAVHIELGDLPGRAAGLPTGPVVVMCGHGERAMTAASLLTRTGRRDLAVLDGGPDTWAQATGAALKTGS